MFGWWVLGVGLGGLAFRSVEGLGLLRGCRVLRVCVFSCGGEGLGLGVLKFCV